MSAIVSARGHILCKQLQGVSALDKIPIDQRIIVELKNIEGRSHKEIAEFLGISVTAAKVRLHRAHQKLRQILEEVER